jgi:hypothetical protein
LASRTRSAWEPRGDWRHGSAGGTDPLNLILPTVSRTELARTVYLWIMALILAGIGARTRDARLAWIGVALFGVLAVRRHAVFAGHPIGGPAPMPPAWLTGALPFLAGIQGWYRAAGIAAVFLAPAAALGADSVGRRVPLLALAALVAADGLGLSDAPWPRPAYDPRPPPSIAAVTGEGAALWLPFDHGDRRWPAGVPRVWQRWQPWLGRPVSEAYEAADALLANPWCRSRTPRAWAVACAPTIGSRRRPRQTWSRPPRKAKPRSPLRAARVEVIAVVLPRAVTPNRCETVLERHLGAATGQNDDVVWAL